MFTGGGDWRTLPVCAKSVDWMPDSCISVGVGGAAFELVVDGDRLCLWRYEADRGGDGRPRDGDTGPFSLYDELRLRAGLFGFEDAGDCCDGGVYGISPAGAVGTVMIGR